MKTSATFQKDEGLQIKLSWNDRNSVCHLTLVNRYDDGEGVSLGTVFAPSDENWNRIENGIDPKFVEKIKKKIHQALTELEELRQN